MGGLARPTKTGQESIRENGPKERGHDARDGTHRRAFIKRLKEAAVELTGGRTMAQARGKIGFRQQTLRLSSGQALLSVAPAVRWPAKRPGKAIERAGDRD